MTPATATTYVARHDAAGASATMAFRPVQPPPLATLRIALLAAAAVAAALAASVWSRGLQRRAQIVAEAAASEQRARAMLPSQAESLVMLRRTMIASKYRFIIAPTPAQAATELADVIAGMADAENITLGTVRAVADPLVRNGVRVTTLDAEVTGASAGVLSLLHSLEQGEPALRVTSIAITPVTSATTATDQTRLRIRVAALARELFPFER